MKHLSKSQEKILAYLRECSQNGLPPSVREICNATGIKSTSTVHAHLKALEKDGYIYREAGLNRAIHISGTHSIQVPLVKKFRSTAPLFRSQDIESYVAYNAFFEIENELFALYMPDGSMIPKNILEHDIIIAERSDSVTSGDIVVALHKDKIYVRNYLERGQYKGLVSENISYRPIKLEPAVNIIGRVVSIIRYL